MRLMSTAEAARLLGVSAATVRNWNKAGYIAPATDSPFSYSYSDVAALRKQIRGNRFARLRARANKSAADTPAAGVRENAEIITALNGLPGTATLRAAKPDRTLFAAALHLLRKYGEAVFPTCGTDIDFDDIQWRRNTVRDVMAGWLRRSGGRGRRGAGGGDGGIRIRGGDSGGVKAFLERDDEDDRLGVLYQGLLSVGARSRTGSYFTPWDIVDASIASLGKCPGSFLDPCCGTGRYLLRAAKEFSLSPDCLYGFDADPLAVDIARVNLLLHYADFEGCINVHCLDSLRDLATGTGRCSTNALIGSIDAIATNPPWGGGNAKRKLTARRKKESGAGSIASGEPFSLFLEKSLALLKPGGRLSFLLPESILKIKAHADIRGLLLRHAAISRIALLGRPFHDVATSIIRLDLSKQKAQEEWKVQIVNGSRIHKTRQKRFAGNIHCAFDVTVTEEDAGLIDKIYSVPHHTLRNHAEWALGIVTGDNARHILESPRPEAEPVLRGRDIHMFVPGQIRRYIVFDPERFQQSAPERLYRAREKLVYRFVASRLVFAYDRYGLLTLNSANILIPKLPHLKIKTVLGFLNSDVFQYLFLKQFQTRKILRGDLETLPFPVIDGSIADGIERQVEACINSPGCPVDDLNGLVYDAFRLDRKERRVIRDGVHADLKRVFL